MKTISFTIQIMRKFKLTSNGMFVFVYSSTDGYRRETAYDGRTKVFKKWSKLVKPHLPAVYTDEL